MELFDFQMRIKMNNALATVRARPSSLCSTVHSWAKITESRQPKIWEIDWSVVILMPAAV